MKKANVKSTTKITKSTASVSTKLAIRPGHRLVNGKLCTGKYCDQFGCPTCGATLAETMIPANRPAKPGWDGTSAALPTLEAVTAAYAPVKDRPRQKIKTATYKVATKVARLVVSAEPADKVEKAMTAAAKVAAKKLAPPTASLMHKTLQKAGFKFIQAEKVEGSTAYGYQHKDQRVALLTVAVDGAEAWQVRFTDGATSGGVKLDLFTALLRISTARHDASKKRATEKVGRAVVKSPIDTSVLGAGAEGDDYIAPARLAPEEVAGVPASVARAIEMLGNLTARQFDLDMLRGDKHYGHRLALLKRLFDREKVLVAETGINNLTEAFFSAVGAGDGCKASKMKCFAERCKDIDKKVRTAKAELAKREKALAVLKTRATITKRAVPGIILPYSPELKLNRAQRKIRDAELKESAKKSLLGTSPEQPAVPHPYAEFIPIYEDLRLLEDMDKVPEGRIIMMQMEKANSQGAICVYNNGMRVAAGVVAPETLRTLRVVTNVDLADFAKQLLNPSTPSVPVTSVAARHLTTVLNCCKESDMKTTSVEAPVKGKKFEAKTPAKKTTPKTAKEVGAPRKSSLFRLSNAAAKEWGAFTTQKGEIIAAFKKLNAVGKSVAGVTRGELIEALPDVPAANISFYLSKWQGANIVEKLPAAE